MRSKTPAKLVALAVITALCLSACSPTDFFLGEDNRPTAKPLPQISAALQSQVLWSHHPGDGGRSNGLALQPDGDATSVYVATADGKVVGYDLDSGQVRFQRDLGQDITAGVRYADGRLLLATRAGDLLALNANDGSVLWRVHAGAAILARPAVAGGMVVARTGDGGILAYDLNNGTPLWQYRLSEPNLTVRGYAEPVVGGGIVVLTTDSGRVVILDQASGMPMAEQRLAVGEGNNEVQRLVDMDATGKVNQGVLFGSAYQANTFALDLQTGQLLWVQPQASTAQAVALSPQQLFLHNDIDHVFALSQRDGRILWENADLEGRYLSPLVAVGNVVGGVDREGYMHWLDSNSGQLVGQTRISSDNASAEPFVGPNVIVWQMGDGDVVAIRPTAVGQ